MQTREDRMVVKVSTSTQNHRERHTEKGIEIEIERDRGRQRESAGCSLTQLTTTAAGPPRLHSRAPILAGLGEPRQVSSQPRRHVARTLATAPLLLVGWALPLLLILLLVMGGARLTGWALPLLLVMGGALLLLLLLLGWTLLAGWPLLLTSRAGLGGRGHRQEAVGDVGSVDPTAATTTGWLCSPTSKSGTPATLRLGRMHGGAVERSRDVAAAAGHDVRHGPRWWTWRWHGAAGQEGRGGQDTSVQRILKASRLWGTKLRLQCDREGEEGAGRNAVGDREGGKAEERERAPCNLTWRLKVLAGQGTGAGLGHSRMRANRGEPRSRKSRNRTLPCSGVGSCRLEVFLIYCLIDHRGGFPGVRGAAGPGNRGPATFFRDGGPPARVQGGHFKAMPHSTWSSGDPPVVFPRTSRDFHLGNERRLPPRSPQPGLHRKYPRVNVIDMISGTLALMMTMNAVPAPVLAGA